MKVRNTKANKSKEFSKTYYQPESKRSKRPVTATYRRVEHTDGIESNIRHQIQFSFKFSNEENSDCECSESNMKSVLNQDPHNNKNSTSRYKGEECDYQQQMILGGESLGTYRSQESLHKETVLSQMPENYHNNKQRINLNSNRFEKKGKKSKISQRSSKVKYLDEDNHNEDIKESHMAYYK